MRTQTTDVFPNLSNLTALLCPCFVVRRVALPTNQRKKLWAVILRFVIVQCEDSSNSE